MTLLHILVLALVQGVTEFLPISSSGHLILLPMLFGWPDQGQFIDVAVHMGTLVAVLLYFSTDVKGLSLAAFAILGVKSAQQNITKLETDYRKMFLTLIIGTIPMVIVGGLLVTFSLSDALRHTPVIAATSIIFGVILYVADTRCPHDKGLDKLTLKSALMIGMSQIFALIPGTSRSGVTMTAARALGFSRPEAARFSMLLSIPAILASGTATLLSTFKNTVGPIPYFEAGAAMALSCLFALAAIHFLMRWIARTSMTIFVVYRIGLGILLFALIGNGYIA